METTQNENKPITVLSLFDGISVLQESLSQLKIPVSQYFASEIDKHGITVTNHHFPGTVQLGDVRDVKGSELPQIDLMVFGSPCQDLSGIRMNRNGLEGEQSGLFFEALRILKEVKPKYWLMENVASMSKVDRDKISALLGVEPIYINSNLVSAANRARLYWTNIPNIELPEDRGIKLKEIVDGRKYVDKEKANCVLTKGIAYTPSGLKRYLLKGIGQVVYKRVGFTMLSKEERLCLVDFMSEEQLKKEFRLMTIKELERLQTLPEGYVEPYVGKTAAHHCIGNAFTLEVIKHIIGHIDFEGNGQ